MVVGTPISLEIHNLISAYILNKIFSNLKHIFFIGKGICSKFGPYQMYHWIVIMITHGLSQLHRSTPAENTRKKSFVRVICVVARKVCMGSTIGYTYVIFCPS